MFLLKNPTKEIIEKTKFTRFRDSGRRVESKAARKVFVLQYCLASLILV